MTRTGKPISKPWRPTARSTASSLLFLALAAAGAAEATLYRWVDAQGRVHYSDTPPPSYNQTGGAELNRQGAVIRHNQSEAERQAEAARRVEAEKQAREARMQAQRDRALMQTYTSEAEIDLARDRAEELHRLAIQSARLRLGAVEATLAEVNARIDTVRRNGRTPGQGLLEQKNQAERERGELLRAIARREASIGEVRARFEADKARYRVLSGGAPQGAQTAPAP